MGENSNALHEDAEVLGAAGVDRHRAIASIMEELEAVDWYDQRVAATADAELAAVLAHNRDEEKEHAAMTLEWLRRHDPTLDAVLRRYLFSDGPIVAVEHDASDQPASSGSPPASSGSQPPARRGPADAAGDGSLSIGSLRQGKEQL